ncbi:MAG: glycosyl transferase family 1 [Lentisphaerae bacterium GWF2_57_35]|nr:MAG: glycosyl transferase family 1 [Lentisphaerae bacterium GWF2_57_35]
MPGITPWKSSRLIEPRRIGFVSTRFAGTDGVSLESAKWAAILASDKHKCFWYSGRSDRDSSISLCIPEANFGHPENVWINEEIWGKISRSPLVSRRIHDLAEYLKSTLYDFVRQFGIDILLVENALSIPMHVPLGVAITEFLIESRTPTIAHHHDFYWERTRFSINAVQDCLEMCFPPRDPLIQHVVINQAAQEELSWRKGVPTTLVPNALDYSSPPPPMDSYSTDVRTSIGLQPHDVMILQPTRVIPRKGIEHAITLLERLGNPKYKLIVSHESGDEGMDYRHMLVEWAHNAGVDLRFVETRISDVRQYDREGKKMYTLWDLYQHADLVTYPSLYEGFGNAFLEAVYFRVPVLVNRYAIFGRDIEPKGFKVPIMDGFITQKVVDDVRRILEDKEHRKQMVDHNYEVAARFFDYTEVRRKLRMLIVNLMGAAPRP